MMDDWLPGDPLYRASAMMELKWDDFSDIGSDGARWTPQDGWQPPDE